MLGISNEAYDIHPVVDDPTNHQNVHNLSTKELLTIIAQEIETEDRWVQIGKEL
jgi:hypothetical protein